MDLLTLSALLAVGAYGDPREDGLPSHEERELILWTNAARVDPEAFADEYQAGGCSTDDFSEDELTAGPPLYIDVTLTDAARYHSEDMADTPCFQHESCDGTDTWERIGRFYEDSAGAMGENIAQGYPDVRNVVLSGWMCSHDGHRANIMSKDFNEMGAGVASGYYTQDFANGQLNEGSPPVRVAVDSFRGGYYADWGADAGPAEITVVRDGIETPMALEWGSEEQGIYSVEEAGEGTAACHQWYLAWETAEGETGTFPGGGSWIDGECDEDNELGWINTQYPPEGLFGDVPEDQLEEAMLADITLVGCSTSPASASWLLVGFAALTMGRRKPPTR